VRVRLATRGSKLALIQAQLAAEALGRRFPEHEFVLEAVTTQGDRHPTMRLSESPREGVFVKELERALADGRAELAVHSAKDLPTMPTPGLVLAAFLARADARDVLIARERATLMTLPPGARIGTGSPRRVAQLLAVRPDLRTVEIRGNVDTRLRRLAEGAVDGLVLAAAGLERLGRLGEVHEFLSFDVMLPAPGQGALVLQAVEGSPSAELAAAIDDRPTSRAVLAERSLLRTLGGGCLSAIGAYGVVRDGQLALRAVVLDPDGKRLVRADAHGRPDETVITDVAAQLQREGAATLLNSRGGPLAGMRVMVTRADGQAEGLAQALEVLGASVVACPVIAIEPIEVDPNRLAGVTGYDWLILTSANGVDRWFQLLRSVELEFPTHIKVAAIGPQTAGRLRAHGIEPAFVPDRYIAEDLADGLAGVISAESRVLLARASGSREVLPDRLRAAGAAVDVLETYRAVPPPNLARRLSDALASVDFVTFTSSSTVRHFVDAVGTTLAPQTLVACIGPVTAETARALGLQVDIIAEEFTTGGLVDAIVRHRAPVSA
jgi:hydroxymethylbilane synthase